VSVLLTSILYKDVASCVVTQPTSIELHSKQTYTE